MVTKWIDKKKIAGVFSVVSFIVGFLFLNKDVTGNIILEEGSSFNIIPFVGLLFVLCSGILALYATKK